MAALRTATLSATLLVAGAAALAAITQGFQSFTYQTALEVSVREQPRPLPAVGLQDESGQLVDFHQYTGQWLLIDFIYTRCLTICSAQGGVFAQLRQDLREPIAEGRVRLLSISFDPLHDDPAALARYRARFSAAGDASGWTALRPTDAPSLQALSRTFGLKIIADGLGGYEHNSAIHIVNPDGKLVSVQAWDDAQGAARYLRERLAS